MLDTQPTSTVSIAISDNSDPVSDVTVTSRLSFSTSDWNRPKPVTVRLASGAAAGATVTHTATSSDDCYAASDDCEADDRVTISDVTVLPCAPAPPTRSDIES